jgi:hypothetical protein
MLFSIHQPLSFDPPFTSQSRLAEGICLVPVVKDVVESITESVAL